MGSARKRQSPKVEESAPGGRRKESAKRVFPPEAYAIHEEVKSEVVKAIQQRADAEFAGDELVAIEGDGGDD
jgi:hypothetical protein